MIQRWIAFLFLSAVGGAGIIEAQELPVSRVVLYTSGVGYFEHRGNVSGDASVPLTFTEDQINDVLKSLILRDPGGSVGVVGYPSQDPLDKSLKSFALDLGGPGGLEALLPQLRGVNLTLNTPATVTGRLVGLDKRTTAERTETWLTLASDAGLKLVPLSSVTGLSILDAKVERELGQALALVAASRDSNQKLVTAQFKGTGSRTVSLGYIVEAPVWKTSYRLDLSGSRPFLQAWAIVENTGEVDWTQVRLSLVSGRPVSFVQDLYTPLYVARPVYEPETEAGPAPRLTGAGMAPPAPAMAPMMSKSAAPASRGFAAEDEAYEPEPNLRDSGFRPAASAAAAGELFEFSLQSPVSLARHRSALIPLAAADVEARKVSLYNPAVDSLHPQQAVWLTNTTGLRLPSGPVTIYDAGVYAGDALTDSMVENDRRLWTYATDISVRAERTETGAQVTTKITVVRGVLNYRKDLTWTTTYRLANLAAEAKTVVVEHPYRQERTLVVPVNADERTPEVWRFSVPVAAGQTVAFDVGEKRTIVETEGLSGWRADQVLALVKGNGPLSFAARAALQKVADERAAVEKALVTVGELERQKAEIEADQVRTRSNLAAVGRDSTQGQSYLKRLLDSEAKIDQTAADLAAARKTLALAQKTLEDELRTLTVE